MTKVYVLDYAYVDGCDSLTQYTIWVYSTLEKASEALEKEKDNHETYYHDCFSIDEYVLDN